jgi:steroid 5-alpha reductase family enzyme
VTQTEALCLTLAIEVPIAVGLVAWRRWAPGRLGVVALVGVLASVVTHPLLWVVDPMLQPALGTPIRWALLETAIALVEAGVYVLGAGIGVRRALVTSLLANGVSFAVGLAIYAAA